LVRGDLGIQVHHIVPQNLFDGKFEKIPQAPLGSPLNNSLMDQVQRLKDAGFAKNDLENLIPMPTRADQLEDLIEAGFHWDPGNRHSGKHPFEYYDRLNEDQVEFATFEYVDWFNHHRLHAAIGNRPSVEHETLFYNQQTVPETGPNTNVRALH